MRDVDSRLVGRSGQRKGALRCAGWQAQICGRSNSPVGWPVEIRTMEGFKLVKENVRQGSSGEFNEAAQPRDITG